MIVAAVAVVVEVVPVFVVQTVVVKVVAVDIAVKVVVVIVVAVVASENRTMLAQMIPWTMLSRSLGQVVCRTHSLQQVFHDKHHESVYRQIGCGPGCLS